jgi:hypothetical protein
MADIPNPFITDPALADPEYRFVLDETAFMAAIAPPSGAQHDDFAKVNRLLEELADAPPAFIAAPSQAYLQAVEAVETCLRQRRAATG